MQEKKGYLQIGQVLKSNGTDGTLVIRLFEEPTEPVFIFWDELPVPYFMDIVSERGTTKILAHLTDVNTLEDAEELASRAIYVRRDDEPEEEFEDFTGWTLVNTSSNMDEVIGTIEDIEDIPGNPCLVVGENLIPLHEDLVEEIDERHKILRMNLPEGLLAH